MTERDAHGRFAKAGVEAVAFKPTPMLGVKPEQGSGAVLGIDPHELLNVPEICQVAVAGEKMGAYVVKEGEVAVRFWPLLTNFAGRDPYAYPARNHGGYSVSGATSWVINTKAERDLPTDSTHTTTNHYSRVVRGLEYPTGHPFSSGTTGVCRGNVSFLPDPIASGLLLRNYVIQNMSHSGWAASYVGYAKQWWESHGEEFWREFPRASFILVPTEKPDVPVSSVHALSKELVEQFLKGEAKEVWLPAKEVESHEI